MCAPSTDINLGNFGDEMDRRPRAPNDTDRTIMEHMALSGGLAEVLELFMMNVMKITRQSYWRKSTGDTLVHIQNKTHYCAVREKRSILKRLKNFCCHHKDIVFL